MNNSITRPVIEDAAQRMFASLVAEPLAPWTPFIHKGPTIGQIHGRAQAVIRQSHGGKYQSPICLCAKDKGLVSAALLATLSKGPPLLIPYAFDADTLNGARASMPYTHALVEGASPLPPGIQRITIPDVDDSAEQPPVAMPRQWDSTWLYLFTGGSTGKPQLWSKTPRNLLTEACYLAKTFGITHEDTILATVPTNHIYGLLYAILIPMVTGASVCSTTPSFPHEIAQDIEASKATVLVSIPAHYRALKKAPITRHRLRLAFSSAGALADRDAVDFFVKTGIAVTEIYGSTETGGIAQRRKDQQPSPLYPFDCVDVQIRDRQLSVRSSFLSTELEMDAEGFFETSDRARWVDASGFGLLGRSDGIVKVGGKRVDLGLTKQALMGVEGVRDAYVYTRPVQSGRENEILALVEGSATPDQLMQAAMDNLPAWARPRSIMVVDQIPLSSTGKYNRREIEKFFPS